MATSVIDTAGAAAPPRGATCPPTIALLGCGTVGAAFARALAGVSPAGARIIGALVRDPARPRGVPCDLELTRDAEALLARGPAVVVELLGGTEPARSLVLRALARRIPVVTANKTLLARHGREIVDAAAATGTPLLYEAAVLAGVPFLGTFARRPHTATARGLAGIANGTSNFVLTLCARENLDLAAAVHAAQRLGYAEPRPQNDVGGIDAAEKLAVLLRHFAGADVHPDAIETEGIAAITRGHIADAHSLGGRLRPVIVAGWTRDVEAFAGPAFVPDGHPLAAVEGVENALILDRSDGRLLFQGPGAGADVTAAAVLDDVHEVMGGGTPPAPQGTKRVAPRPVETGWMISIAAPRLPRGAAIADLLASYAVYTRRATGRTRDPDAERVALLTWPVERERLEAALIALRDASGCSTSHVRALEHDR